MKGQSSLTEEAGGTVIVIVFVLAIALISLSYYGISKINGSSPAAYSLEFVNFATKPFLVSHSLSFYKIDDRQFLEQALESAVTGSAETASAGKMPEWLRSFIGLYDFNTYFIEIKNSKSSALAFDNRLKGCGADDNGDKKPDGVCASKAHQDYGNCGLSRDEIPDMNGACGFFQTCCKEVSRDEENHEGVIIKIERCGPKKVGVCSRGNLAPPSSAQTAPRCPEGRDYYRDNICEVSNLVPDTLLGQTTLTPVCCVPIDPESLEASGLSATAQTPLLFNRTKHYGGGGVLEVTTG